MKYENIADDMEYRSAFLQDFQVFYKSLIG